MGGVGDFGPENADSTVGIRIRHLRFDIRCSNELNIRLFEYSSIRYNLIFGHIKYFNIQLNRLFGQPNIRLYRIFEYRIFELQI